MPPAKYKQGKIKTQNVSLAKPPLCCVTGTHSSFAAHERIFDPAWRQIFQHAVRTLCVIKLDAGGRPRLESALEVRPFRSGSSISGKPDAEADLKLGIDNGHNM